MATTTTNISLTKPAQTDETNIVDDFNDNMDLIDAAFEDVLAFDTSLVLRGNLSMGAFNIEGVDATEFGYLNGISSFGGTLIDDANASTARATLGLVIGTDVQASDAGLLSIAGLTTAANKMIYTTALDTYAVIDLTAFARSILDDGDEATFKATVNLEIGTDVAASGANSDITSMTGLSNDGIPLAKIANAASDGENTDITSLTGVNLIDTDILNFADATELTLDTNGEITITQSYHRVDTFEDAATDNLAVINGGTAGDIIYICAANDARTVVIKHDDTAGAGKIVTSEAADFDLDTDDKVVALIYDSADSHWHMQAVSASTFLHLTDTPEAYTGAASKVVAVNAGETALEFIAAGGGETNTASNIGAQIEIYKQKTGVDLELRTLKADSDKITVSVTPVSINAGYEAIDRDTSLGIRTAISKGNPADATGTILSVEIWALSELSNCEVATFYEGAANTFTTRDNEAIGTVTAGSKQTFNVNLDVQAGDYIGLYYSAGTLELSTTGGAGAWWVAFDCIPCTDQLFDSYDNYMMSLYGTSAGVDLDYIKFDIVPSEIAKDIGGLLSTTTVAFNTNADTTLYTVPTGKRCVLTKAVVVAAGDAGATTTVSIGQNTAETDFIPANTLSNLDAQYDSVILQPIPNTTPLKIKSYATTTVIEARVATQSGAAGNTIYLFGILY